MSQQFSFDSLPDKSTSSFKEGNYELQIKSVDEVVSKSTGSVMIQFTYDIVGTKMQLRFDNCPVSKANGEPINFGLSKLKKIMKATGVTPKDFTASMLNQLMNGKRFIAHLVTNDKGYPVMDQNIDTIVALEKAEPVQETSLGEVEDTVDQKLNITTTHNW